jgi:hypothetical protein
MPMDEFINSRRPQMEGIFGDFQGFLGTKKLTVIFHDDSGMPQAFVLIMFLQFADARRGIAGIFHICPVLSPISPVISREAGQ